MPVHETEAKDLQLAVADLLHRLARKAETFRCGELQ
jgi:hypothetical protein